MDGERAVALVARGFTGRLMRPTIESVAGPAPRGAQIGTPPRVAIAQAAPPSAQHGQVYRRGGWPRGT